jgi:hypothetical protein
MVSLCIHRAIAGHSHSKWYVSRAIALLLSLTRESAISGVWGWDPLTQSCWEAVTEPSERRSWVVGTQYIPNLLCSSIAFVSTMTVLGHLLLAKLRTDRLFTTSSTVNSKSSRSDLISQVATRILWYPTILSALSYSSV